MIKSLFQNLIFLTVTFLTVHLNAQDDPASFLSGSVGTQEGNPIKNAIITTNTGHKAFTDAEGNFKIKASGLTHLVVESDFYQNKTVQVNAVDAPFSIVLDEVPLYLGENDKVNVPFGQLEKGRLVGSVAAIDVDEHLDDDQRINVGAAINGKVGGVFFNSNLLGIGTATYIIDGIPRDESFVNLTEIEEISVLKDPVSRSLYGSQADKGIILITTKRGTPFKRELSVRADYGILEPRQLPEYLGAADYMEAFNQANINDGFAAFYTQDEIAGTRAGSDPIRFPDESYYNSTFIKDAISYLNVNLEAAGGSEAANYFLNIGFNNTEGWLNLGDGDISNRVNLRANTDYKLSDNLRAKLDAVAVFNFFASPDVFTINNQGNQNDNQFQVIGDFWTTAQQSLPNAAPLLIPIDRLGDPSSVSNANLVDGQFLLGGTNEFPNNVYGDLLQSGRKTEISRYLQLNTGLEWDLDFITEGLSASADLTFDLINTTVENQLTDYAVYQPLFLQNQAGQDSLAVTQIGQDVLSNERQPIADESTFSRRVGVFGTIDYKKNWKDNRLDLTALFYANSLTLPNVFVDNRVINYGLRANYMLKEKYIAEFSGVMTGSRKLPLDDNYAFSPSVGLGWIISKERFINTKRGSVNFLKLRGTAGLINNDGWENNFLYQSYFNLGGFFNYGNTNGNSGIRNAELQYGNVASPIDWQKRFEWNFGFEGLFFNRSLYFEGSYFNSRSYDLVATLNNTVPDLLGYQVTTNNDEFVDRGLEYHLRYTGKLSDNLKLTLTASTIQAVGRVKNVDESFFPEDAQQRSRIGRRSDAIFGLTADGLYGPNDFNADGTLVSSLPAVSFGNVQPGDIKYLDTNGDGVIDPDDQSVIGYNSPDLQYSLSLNLEYKNFEFFMLGIGLSGDDNIRNGDYFWTSGNAKYPAHALSAYGPGNENVNAAFPRLSANNNNNNFRNSTFWLYDNNSFSIPTMQLSYNYRPKQTKGTIKNVKLFVRGDNLLILNKNREISDLRFGVGSSPVTKGVSMGLVTSF